MFLEQMKTTDFDPKKKYTFVLPMGATEQHGPFLPMGTDSFLADRIIREAEIDFRELIFLPTFRITCSEEHDGFMGTTWISKETMTQTLQDICHSLQLYADKIIFTSFHGGNLKLLDTFIEENKELFGGVQIFHLQMGSEEAEEKMRKLLDGPTDAHAGNVEISMMLATDELLTKVPPADYPKHVIEDAFSTNRLQDFSTDGIADNNPTWVVSKENGVKMIEWIVEDFKKELRKIA